VVDALNVRVHEIHAITISMLSSDLKDRILEVVTLDQHYVQIKESLQHSDVQHKFKDYKMEEDGILLYETQFMYLILKR
jgi:hypothetical protein